jgi:anti-sigma-K factor RskA
MTASDIHSLSGAYALDAVDDLERAAFERHLRECETCALEVSELRETVTRLADTAAIEPPPSLRASVLDAVTRTAQTRPGRSDRAHVVGHAAAAQRWRRFAAVSVAAGVIAAGAGVGTWAVATRNVDDARRHAVEAQQRVAAIEAVLAAPDVKVFTMAASGGGTINVAVSRLRNEAVAVLNDMPDLGLEQVYQLWMIPEAGLSSARSPGPLAVGQTTGSQVLEVGNAVQFGVSVEPKSGSATPTGPVIAAIKIAS